MQTDIEIPHENCYCLDLREPNKKRTLFHHLQCSLKYPQSDRQADRQCEKQRDQQTFSAACWETILNSVSFISNRWFKFTTNQKLLQIKRVMRNTPNKSFTNNVLVFV